MNILKKIFILPTPRPIPPPYTHLVQVGDPVLRTKAENVPKDILLSNQGKKVIRRLIHAMKMYELIGLSAPQLGLPWRIFAIHFPESDFKNFSQEEIRQKQMEILPLQVWVNPVITILDHDQSKMKESCGSVNGYQAIVKRYNKIMISGLDDTGEPQRMEYSGWPARMIQHEMDHLNGIVFTDVMEPKTFECAIWKHVNEKRGTVMLKFSPRKWYDMLVSG